MSSDAPPKSSMTPPPARTLDTTDATRIGIGAIVGGGIFVLAGTAFAHAGPGAILAFALNGVLALLTAMSFAEMATAFPESGGAYVFARRVLSVRAAFGAGWVLWLAYIVAGVLYAQGFAAYGMELARALLALAGHVGEPPVWASPRAGSVWAAVPLVLYTLSLIRRASGGGALATWGKVVALIVLVVAAAAAVGFSGRPLRPLRPFLPLGGGGLLSAMGYTFIALQGFDLIAAVAGEVKDPEQAVVRGMLRSLWTALAIYLPLLLLIALGGAAPGESVQGLAAAAPDTFMATAAGTLLGPAGYWLVLVAAVLSTLSALHANIMAASRVAFRMASDRTLPGVLSMRHPERGTPVMALYVSALTMGALIFVLPGAATAGAAASLIFLLSFALAHVTAYLARARTRPRRSSIDVAPVTTYRTPLFPAVPIVGGLSCFGLAAFQILHEPHAAVIVLIWLGLGVVLYIALFAERAQALDAAAEVRDEDLLRLRGQEPLVLVPVVNPASARAMAQVASALTPPRVGRVVMLSVLARGSEDIVAALAQQQQTLGVGLAACLERGQRPEALVTVAINPWREIYRVARDRSCERLLIGMSAVGETERVHQLEELMGRLRCELSVLNAPPEWDLDEVGRILVPVGGRGNHDQVRARLLAGLCADRARRITLLRILPSSASPDAVGAARRSMEELAREEGYANFDVQVVCTDDVVEAASAAAADTDLVVLGLQRQSRNRRGFSSLGLEIAKRCPVATIMIGGR